MLPCINILITFAKKSSQRQKRIKDRRRIGVAGPNLYTESICGAGAMQKVMVSMTDAVMENYKLCTACLYQHDPLSAEKIRENESFLDKTESVLGNIL